VGELDRLLRNSVKLRMIADVPLGAFLSGGVDLHGCILMQAQSDRPSRRLQSGSKKQILMKPVLRNESLSTWERITLNFT